MGRDSPRQIHQGQQGLPHNNKVSGGVPDLRMALNSPFAGESQWRRAGTAGAELDKNLDTSLITKHHKVRNQIREEFQSDTLTSGLATRTEHVKEGLR